MLARFFLVSVFLLFPAVGTPQIHAVDKMSGVTKAKLLAGFLGCPNADPTPCTGVTLQLLSLDRDDVLETVRPDSRNWFHFKTTGSAGQLYRLQVQREQITIQTIRVVLDDHAGLLKLPQH